MSQTDEANRTRDELVAAEYRELVRNSQIPCLTGEVDQIANSVRQQVCKLYMDELAREIAEQISAEESVDDDATEGEPVVEAPEPGPVQPGTIPPPTGV